MPALATRIDIGAVLQAAAERCKEVRVSSHYNSLREWSDHVKDLTNYYAAPNTIRRYEMGEDDGLALSFGYVVALCHAARVNPCWIITGDGPRTWDRMASQEEVMAAALEEAARRLRAG